MSGYLVCLLLLTLLAMLVWSFLGSLGVLVLVAAFGLVALRIRRRADQQS
ncbi:MAG TPA: hypothetical protein VFV89_09190 [Nocardioides sp.]|nr:hypothetical protein [Nocardioides sp.]HEX5087972.1 hypothetical protein [Nocardioides sp.]